LKLSSMKFRSNEVKCREGVHFLQSAGLGGDQPGGSPTSPPAPSLTPPVVKKPSSSSASRPAWLRMRVARTNANSSLSFSNRDLQVKDYSDHYIRLLQGNLCPQRVGGSVMQRVKANSSLSFSKRDLRMKRGRSIVHSRGVPGVPGVPCFPGRSNVRPLQCLWMESSKSVSSEGAGPRTAARHPRAAACDLQPATSDHYSDHYIRLLQGNLCPQRVGGSVMQRVKANSSLSFSKRDLRMKRGRSFVHLL
jgi:hypothetical protein